MEVAGRRVLRLFEAVSMRGRSIASALCPVLGAFALVASGCTGHSSQVGSNDSGGGARHLAARPLRLPKVTSACSATTGARKVTRGYAPAVGTGPIYIETGGFEFPTIPFAYPPPRQSQFFENKWGGQILKLIGSPRYRGPVLIRGRELDGAEVLRFGPGPHPSPLLRLPRGLYDPGVGGFTGWGSYVRLRAPGCYGIQIDGTSFSELVIFRAERVKHPPASP